MIRCLLILAGFIVLTAFVGNLPMAIVGSLFLVVGASLFAYERRDNLTVIGFFTVSGISTLALIRAVGGGSLAAIIGVIVIVLIAIFTIQSEKVTN